MMKKNKRPFLFLKLNQQGAMFGMDARIALIIASVLAATGGVTMVSRLESNKVDGVERGVLVLRDALENHYRTTGITSLSANIATLFSTGFVEDTTLQTDPWGNSWNYNTTSATKSIEGVSFTVNMAVIHSNGKNATNDSTNISSEAEYNAWAPQGDDIGTKFSTIEIEKERVVEYRERARQIVDKLSAHEAGRFLLASNTCAASPSHSYCSHNSLNQSQYNYYPQSDLDASGATYFDPTVSGDQQLYTAGNTADMQQLLQDVGLSTTYATDPWGRVLYYNSNATNRTLPPYTASICFSSGGNCF